MYITLPGPVINVYVEWFEMTMLHWIGRDRIDTHLLRKITYDELLEELDEVEDVVLTAGVVVPTVDLQEVITRVE